MGLIQPTLGRKRNESEMNCLSEAEVFRENSAFDDEFDEEVFVTSPLASDLWQFIRYECRFLSTIPGSMS